MKMNRVVIESPLSGAVERNKKYLSMCIMDCLKRGESPYASHALFPHYLDDNNPLERELGIKAGLEWGKMADTIAVYEDFGISEGMQLGIDYYKQFDIPIVHRKIL